MSFQNAVNAISEIQIFKIFRTSLGGSCLTASVIMMKYNNWVVLVRFGDERRTRWQNMAEFVFSWGVSEIM